jgi:AraC family transcriptional regulator, regulatory protein of adaptative response / methylated-DNA-[protein]-cysteine methyltransferase
VAAILLGDDRAKLRRQAAVVLAGGKLEERTAEMRPVLDAVAAVIEGPDRGPAVALDLRGSALELAVWRALRGIPRGETTTYGRLARALPVAATAQEVGAACAANRIAVAVPCHRVVKADGGIAGYRWGAHRKRRLIERERTAARAGAGGLFAGRAD